MDRGQGVAAATGAVAGAAVAVLVVLTLGDTTSRPGSTLLPIVGRDEASRDLMAAAEELRAAAQSLRSAPSEAPEPRRTKAPDPVPASARLDDLAELVERLERVAAMTARARPSRRVAIGT